MLKNLIKKHERKISAVALLVGFSWDTITLTRIDYLFEVIVLGTHTSLIILWITLINLVDGGVLKWGVFKWIRNIAPILMQVSFGALFSGLTVFYIKSASLSVSLLFVLFLAGLLIGNEFFRTRYQRFIFQLSILYVALASFFSLYFPVLFEHVGAGTFILANIAAGIVIFLLASFLSLFIKDRVRTSRTALGISIISIFVLMQVLYFTNVIPPVPLALKDRGIYHNIYRAGDTYIAEKENESLIANFLPGTTIHFTEGESLFFYSSVFAPIGLSTSIAHEWQYYDEDRNTWISQGKITFPIAGGRNNGYRGYTQKSNLFEGRWRVRVITQRNQVLGQNTFMLEQISEPLPQTRIEL